MTGSRFSPFLMHLMHDVRLEVYSHIILPPFDGCQEYTGLLLSCRQLKEEMDREGTRQLRAYLHSISQSSTLKSDGDDLLARNPDEGGCSFRSMELIDPSTTLGHPTIGVRVPFLLPPVEHDWHFQEHRPIRLCGLTHYSSLPRNPRVAVGEGIESNRSLEKNLYKRQVSDLLGPVRQLHKLHANLEIHLVVSESTANIINTDTRLQQDVRYFYSISSAANATEGGPPHRDSTTRTLASTVLGRLLDMYVSRLGEQSCAEMRCWSEDWAFNTKTIDLTWDFASQCSDVNRQDVWRPTDSFKPCEAVSGRTSYTEDRRKGCTRISLDIKSYIQNLLTHIKKNVRRGTIMARIRTESPSDGLHDRNLTDLVQTREKLHKLGVAEGEDPELDENEIRFEARVTEIEARRAMSTP